MELKTQHASRDHVFRLPRSNSVRHGLICGVTEYPDGFRLCGSRKPPKKTKQSGVVPHKARRLFFSTLDLDRALRGDGLARASPSGAA